MAIFRTTLRRIGTSYGVIIPKKMLKEEKVKLGERLEMAILKRRRIQAIEKAFGLFRGARPFRREYEPDRV